MTLSFSPQPHVSARRPLQPLQITEIPPDAGLVSNRATKRTSRGLATFASPTSPVVTLLACGMGLAIVTCPTFDVNVKLGRPRSPPTMVGADPRTQGPRGGAVCGATLIRVARSMSRFMCLHARRGRYRHRLTGSSCLSSFAGLISEVVEFEWLERYKTNTRIDKPPSFSPLPIAPSHRDPPIRQYGSPPPTGGKRNGQRDPLGVGKPRAAPTAALRPSCQPARHSQRSGGCASRCRWLPACGGRQGLAHSSPRPPPHTAGTAQPPIQGQG